jgi:hypothetical protein
VLSYEGRPSETQATRAGAIARELGDVMKDFDSWVVEVMPGINALLAGRQLPPIQVAPGKRKKG